MEQKIIKILILAVLVFSLVANGIFIYKSTFVALVIAQRQGYATAMNEVNQMITDGRLIVNQQVTQPITTTPNEQTN